MESTNELQGSLALRHSSLWDPQSFGTLYSQLCLSCPTWFVFSPADLISLLIGNIKSCSTLHQLALKGGTAAPLGPQGGTKGKSHPQEKADQEVDVRFISLPRPRSLFM